MTYFAIMSTSADYHVTVNNLYIRNKVEMTSTRANERVASSLAAVFNDIYRTKLIFEFS